jgi:hypothetical protein
MSQIDLQLLAKQINGQWETALVSKGRFVRAQVGVDLEKLLLTHIRPILSAPRAEGVGVTLSLVVSDPEPLES